MNRPSLDLGDLVEHWTLVGAEQDLVASKHGGTRLGFALLLKFYGRFGRFPRGRAELHQDAVEFVARQLKVPASTLGFYQWSGRTIERHRAEIRRHLGFRECTVVDAEKLADWLAGDYAQKERRYEMVKDAVLAECRADRATDAGSGGADRALGAAPGREDPRRADRRPVTSRRERGCSRWSRSQRATPMRARVCWR